MWAQRLTAPHTFEKESLRPPAAGDLEPGQVLLRLLVAGICGSDLAFFRGAVPPFATLQNGHYLNPPGAPLHELVGEVIVTRDENLEPGARVVGWASGNNALTEMVVTDGEGLFEYDSGLRPEEAIMLQPLACVMHALEQVAAVRDRPELVIEAVGHQVGTLRNAVEAVAPNGQVYYFGIPDDEIYPFPMYLFLRKNARLFPGTTPKGRRRPSLVKAAEHLKAHPEIVAGYVTNLLDADDVNQAFQLAIAPVSGQLKVALIVTG